MYQEESDVLEKLIKNECFKQTNKLIKTTDFNIISFFM